tara:strand:+ start:142 stop:441 length:300 start_codon:yes stop_codon:yes gene_type:complete
MPHDELNINEQWKPEVTESELEEFVDSALWRDIKDIIKMQMDAFSQEALNIDMGIDQVYVLRGRNAFAQLILDLPAQIRGTLVIQRQQEELRKKREKNA